MRVRLCVFGDVHGNAPALRAALEAMRREDPDGYLCTGDLTFRFGEPDVCVDLVRALGCPWVTGNAEQQTLRTEGYRHDAGSPGDQLAGWEADRLGADRLRLLSALPSGVHLHYPKVGRVWLAHGCPPARITPGVRPAGLAEWGDNVADDERVTDWFGSAPPDVFVCGHTHVPVARRIGGTLVVNPGSVGFGIHPEAPIRYQTGNGFARYAVLQWTLDGGWSVRARRVPYDVAAALHGLHDQPRLDFGHLDRLRAFLAAPPASAAVEPVGEGG